MAIDNKFVRVADNNPERCQSINKHGQCPYKSGPHSNYCPMHGENVAAENPPEEAPQYVSPI